MLIFGYHSYLLSYSLVRTPVRNLRIPASC